MSLVVEILVTPNLKSQPETYD